MNPLLTKVPYFFFPGIVYTPLTHSIWENFVFFFPLFGKKKYKLFFIFSQEKFASHSLEKNQISDKKRSKKRYFMLFFATFRIFSNFGGVFFFSKKKPQKNVFFFSQEKFKIHSLTQILRAGKKNTALEKKIQHFHSLTRFLTKNGKS